MNIYSAKKFSKIYTFPFQNIRHLFLFKKTKNYCGQGVNHPPPPFTEMSATIRFFDTFPKTFLFLRMKKQVEKLEKLWFDRQKKTYSLCVFPARFFSLEFEGEEGWARSLTALLFATSLRLQILQLFVKLFKCLIMRFPTLCFIFETKKYKKKYFESLEDNS